MIVIFDLDYTLLDTKKFKDKLAEIFCEEDFSAGYQKYFKNKGVNFASGAYLKILIEEKIIDAKREQKLKSELKKLMKQIDNYLFPNAEKVLKHFKDQGNRLILMTFGDKNWQQAKVKNLSIRRYFDQIIFEDKNKADSKFLRTLKKNRQEVVVINDNAKESREIKKITGEKAKICLLTGPYSNNIKHNWKAYRLDQLI